MKNIKWLAKELSRLEYVYATYDLNLEKRKNSKKIIDLMTKFSNPHMYKDSNSTIKFTPMTEDSFEDAVSDILRKVSTSVEYKKTVGKKRSWWTDFKRKNPQKLSPKLVVPIDKIKGLEGKKLVIDIRRSKLSIVQI